MRVYRSQLRRLNPYYPSDPPQKSDLLPPPLPVSLRAAVAARDPWGVAAHEQQVGQGDPSAIDAVPSLQQVKQQEGAGDAMDVDEVSRSEELPEMYPGR